MRRLLVVLLVISCGVLTASAIASFSPGVGNGDGDRPRTSPCPEGQALVGFRGGVGTSPGGLRVVGRIGAICERKSPRRLIGNLGAGKTRTERHECPFPMVAMGIRAHAGDLVDRVRLICRERKDGKLVGRERVTGSMGGGGGDPYKVRCPPGDYATGFAGSLLSDRKVPDFLRLRCAG
ncbi:MAG: hypothetical protein QOJ22_953 [Thermoleophilaceae bacterium]|nr:hypothetical protein [Thermoleophilaceae bacterium]